MKKVIKAAIGGLQDIGEVCYPRKKEEKLLFFISFSVYVLFTLFIYLYNPDFFKLSAVYGLDPDANYVKMSRLIYMTPFESTFHPILTGLLLPLSIVFKLLQFISWDVSRLACAAFFNAVAAFSLLIVYKYCRNLLNLNLYKSLGISLLFSLQAFVLLIAFIPESFSLSMLFLLIMVYLTTENILVGKKVRFRTNATFFYLISGITISNAIKVVISILFQKGLLSQRLKTIIKSGVITLLIFIVAFGITYFMLQGIGQEAVADAGRGKFFTRAADDFQSIFHFENVLKLFLFEPVLFYNNIHYSYDYYCNPGSIQNPGAEFHYNSVLYPLTLILYFGLFLYSIIVNYKNKAVLLLSSFFAVDIFIHVICSYGLNEAYLYSPHWLYCFPLIIAWLYKSSKSKIQQISIHVLVAFFILIFTINNIPHLMELLDPSYLLQ